MRSKLFVPASRPELFAKAARSAADAISFDLEDAVEESRKDSARTTLAEYLPQVRTWSPQKLLIVRVNAFHTAHFDADLAHIAGPALDMVNIPKVECADTLIEVAKKLDELESRRGMRRAIGILANIETARGLENAGQIARAHPRVAGLQIGYGDLFSSMGIASGEPSATQHVRVMVRMAAGTANVAAYDGAYVDIANPEGFRADAVRAQALGFAGKSCIHPSQIELANAVFRPSEAEVRHALRVLEAAERATADGVGAFVVDGRLVDEPFIARAKAVAALARELKLA